MTQSYSGAFGKDSRKAQAKRTGTAHSSSVHSDGKKIHRKDHYQYKTTDDDGETITVNTYSRTPPEGVDVGEADEWADLEGEDFYSMSTDEEVIEVKEHEESQQANKYVKTEYSNSKNSNNNNNKKEKKNSNNNNNKNSKTKKEEERAKRLMLEEQQRVERMQKEANLPLLERMKKQQV